jgi:hypothetical protein
MTTYRVRYSLYRIEAPSSFDAKKQVCDLMKKMPEKFISVEDASVFDPRRPLWMRFLSGK